MRTRRRIERGNGHAGKTGEMPGGRRRSNGRLCRPAAALAARRPSGAAFRQ